MKDTKVKSLLGKGHSLVELIDNPVKFNVTEKDITAHVQAISEIGVDVMDDVEVETAQEGELTFADIFGKSNEFDDSTDEEYIEVEKVEKVIPDTEFDADKCPIEVGQTKNVSSIEYVMPFIRDTSLSYRKFNLGLGGILPLSKEMKELKGTTAQRFAYYKDDDLLWHEEITVETPTVKVVSNDRTYNRIDIERLNVGSDQWESEMLFWDELPTEISSYNIPTFALISPDGGLLPIMTENSVYSRQLWVHAETDKTGSPINGKATRESQKWDKWIALQDNV